MTDKNVDMTERLQKIGQNVSEFKDSIVKGFKDLDVEVKNWSFTVGQLEKEYTVEVNFKISVKPKKA